MPFNSNSGGGGGGPWGGGNRGGGKNPWGNQGGGGGGRGPNQPPQGPDLDDLIRKGRDQLRVVLGGRGGGGGRGPGGGGGGAAIPPKFIAIGAAVLLLFGWAGMSVYTVDARQQSVELFLGEYSDTKGPGLQFAPWPLITHEVLETQRVNSLDVGVSTGGRTSRDDQGLMLTGDENIVDIDFEVFWNIASPADFIFNLAAPTETIKAVSESAMREVIARSRLRPILSRDRDVIAVEVAEVIQQTLDSYQSGVNINRIAFNKADPPTEVIDSFRDVQAAEQDRDTEEKRAEADANQVLAEARGEVAQILQDAEAYRARVVNEARGEAERFKAVLTEYDLAPDVTRKRLYLETMERVFSDTNKIIIDENTGGGAGGQGVVPYLPLDQLNRRGSQN